MLFDICAVIMCSKNAVSYAGMSCVYMYNTVSEKDGFIKVKGILIPFILRATYIRCHRFYFPTKTESSDYC